MIQNKRIESLDILRGLAMMAIILFHSSIYNYANIHKLDFSHPPIIVVLMSFMALWGGVFIFYSMTINTIKVMQRYTEKPDLKQLYYPVIAGGIYIFLHWVLNICLGRWNNDFVNNRPDLTLVAGSLRNMHFTFPHITKFFEGSSLSTIAFNIIIIMLILSLLLRNGGAVKEKRNYLILGISGLLIMVFSFVRVYIFHYFPQSVESKNYLLATFFSFTVANPYPLLPYLAYGLLASMVGMMLFHERKKALKTIVIPAGLIFLIYGLYGMTQFDKTISKPDFFWYFKTNFELGVFILMVVLTALSDRPAGRVTTKLSFIKWFSRITITIYLLETTTSELFRIIWLQVIPGWNQTINGCLLFGFLNVLLWIVILFFWRKVNFKYSLEYFWVKLFARIGKSSTKMDSLQ
jgi:uncharacterized membrane protein